MNFYDSYNKARLSYELASKLSRCWISKYYCKSDFGLSHLPIERIQSFSQFYFFSCMVESEIIRKKYQIEYKIPNTWHHYPTLEKYSNKSWYKNFLQTFKLVLFRTVDFIAMLFGSRFVNKFQDKKYEVVFVGSRRHLNEISESIIKLSKRFKVLVIGKIDAETKLKFDKGEVDFLDVPSGIKFFRRLDRIKIVFKFLLTRWGPQSSIGNKKICNIFKSGEWKSRLLYLKLMLFPEIVALYKLAFKILSTARPAIVITTTSNDTFGASFSLAALAQKIKVAEFQHGFFKVWDFEWEFCNSDFFLTWGEGSRRISRKTVPQQHIVGLPFSKIRFKSHLSQKRIGKNKRILFLWCPVLGSASLYKSELANDTFSKLIKAFSGFPQSWKITIRTHPAYVLFEDLRGLKIPKNIKIHDRASIESALDKHDVIITQATTAGLFAIIKRKPLLFFDNSWLNKKLGNPYVRSGSALNIPENSLDNLYSYVINFINDKDKIRKQRKAQKRFVKQALYKTGRGSTIEIERFVETIIDKRFVKLKGITSAF